MRFARRHPPHHLSPAEQTTRQGAIPRGTLETNKAILTYNAKDDGLGGADPNEALFLSIAIPLAAFAFGLGISRRALDLYVDWSS
jgi:hypothetical protein